MKKILFLLIFFAFAYSQEEPQIKHIKFQGNDAFFSQILGGAIGVENENFWKIWKNDTHYSADDLSEIEDNIVDFYHSKGFFDVVVSMDIKNETAIFNISERDRMRIAKIQMTSPFYIKNMIAAKEGDYFDADNFVKSKENIKRYLTENGYPKTDFDAKAFINIEKYEANLDFNITNPQKSRFGTINLPTLNTIDKEHIADKLAFSEGEYYDARKIEESYKNLYATGVFDIVTIKPNLEDKSYADVPVDVNLTIGKEKSFKIGAGYDTDEGARIKAGWLHKNFMGNLNRLETVAEASIIRQNIGAKLSVPKMFGLEFEDMIKYEKVKYPGFTQKILSNTFKFRLPYKKTSQYIGVLTENGNVEAENDSDLIKSQKFFINALTYEYVVDKRDSLVDAKKGYLFALNAEFSDALFGSNINYVKSNVELRKIVGFDDNSYFRDFLFAAKANIGMINDFKQNDIPVFKRYFAGGSFSNRGYAYRKLGRKDDNGNYIGGNSMIDYSLESRYRVGKSFWGVLFFDSTLLNEKSMMFNGEYKPSVGFGARYDTVVGPVRLDVGFPLREEKRSPVFHISFGQAF